MKKSKKNKTNKNEKPRNKLTEIVGIPRDSLTFWAITLLLGLYFIFAPFSQALFDGAQASFAENIAVGMTAGAPLLLFLGLHLLLRNSPAKKESPLAHLIWLLPLCFAVSTITAASSYYSYFSVLIWVFYAVFFVTGYHLAQNREGISVINVILAMTSYVIVLFGLMNWFGDASLWGLFNWSDVPGQISTTYRDAVLIDANGERLTSVFQYANTYAAFLIAVLLAALVYIVSSKRPAVIALASFLLVPVIVSFMLTLSRGGLVTLPVVLALLLPMLSAPKQLQLLFHLLLGAVASLLILNPVTRMGLELQKQFNPGKAFQAWIIVIAVSAAVAAVSLIFQRYVGGYLDGKLDSFRHIRFSNLILPAAGVLAGALGMYLLFGGTGFVKLLPENIASRIESINLNQHSVLERGTFYQDAMKLWKDYPIIGAGGGAWQALYEKYQNNPYTSRQAHNFYLQILVQIGLLGAIVLLLVLGLVYYYFLRSYWARSAKDRVPYLILAVFATSILVHSAIDFDMSYVFVGTLVFLCLGGMLATGPLPSFPFRTPFAGRGRWLYPVGLLLGFVIFFAVSINHVYAHNLYKMVKTNAAGGQPINLQTLNRALDMVKHPEFADLKLQVLISLYNQTKDNRYAEEADRLLQEVKKSEPYYKQFIYQELNLRRLQNDLPAAIALLESSIPKYPWDIRLYETLAELYYQSGAQYLEANDREKAKSEWRKAFDLRDEVLAKAEYLKTLPEAQAQGRPFGLTPDLSLSLGKIAFVLGDYRQAESYTRARLDNMFDDPVDEEAALFYLASLRKQNRNNQDLADTLFGLNSEMKERLEALVSLPPVE